MSSNDITVYMIGNAHIDPVWLWRWQEGFAEVLATCRSALDRASEYPDFVFTRADAATYAWIEQACPEMFDEIKRRVREGRWSVVGGWWEQPDCNVPSGESFVRHELYGKRYFAEKLGVDVTVGYNADSFGHSAGLPQILAKAGIRYYVFMRPQAHEKDLPDSMFYWAGPDGSRVLAYRLHGSYGASGPDLTDHINASIADRPKGTNVAACFYGVGNHGGGPTIEGIECIRRLQADPDAPKLVFGTLEQFFEHALRERTDYPVVTGDLQHHAVGCYTAHSGMKAWNRKAENALTSAEKLCAMARIASGRACPKERFAEAWQRVLFNQFHDILAGTSIDAAYEDVRHSLGAAIETAEGEANAALQSMACRIDTSGEGEPIVVFNPHAHAVTCPVYLDENLPGLRDHTGRAVPVQIAVPFFEHTGSRQRRVFVDTLPPLGYRVYYSVRSDTATEPSPDLRASETELANGRLRIELDAGNGEVRQVIDLRGASPSPQPSPARGEGAGVGLLAAPAGALVVDDPSDTWSHGVVRFDRVAGRFGNAKIEVIESGPVRATLRVESRFGESSLWQDISLYADLDVIEFRVTVDWREKHRMLKFEFPLAITDPVATADAAYAVASHPADGAENPCQKWIDVTGTIGGKAYGVSSINDGKYGYDVEGSTMRLSAIRSPIYAFHDPRQVGPGKRYHYMDQGLQSFTFRLLPHAGSWQDAGTVREALLLNMPPAAVETHRHRGEMPPECSFGEVSPPNVDLAVLKEAEDDDSLIVRLYETAGKPTEATLTLAGMHYPISMGAFEVKTLSIDGGRAVEVDLTEHERR